MHLFQKRGHWPPFIVVINQVVVHQSNYSTKANPTSEANHKVSGLNNPDILSITRLRNRLPIYSWL